MPFMQRATSESENQGQVVHISFDSDFPSLITFATLTESILWRHITLLVIWVRRADA